MISVLMGVYNCEDTVIKAIESIQNQTVTDWELIICDDGSSDNTYEKVCLIKDKRVKVIRNKQNRGLPYSLNRCLKYATGEYVARMDGDDVSLPNRFEKELAILQQGEFEIVSSWMNLTDDDGNIWGVLRNKEYPQREDLITSSAIAHPVVMMKSGCLRAVKGYRNLSKTQRVEDVDLWIRLYEKGYKAYNIQESLYNMLNNDEARKRRKYKYRINSTLIRMEGCKRLGLSGKYYVYAVKPMVLGLIPTKLRTAIRKKISRKD